MLNRIAIQCRLRSHKEKAAKGGDYLKFVWRHTRTDFSVCIISLILNRALLFRRLSAKNTLCIVDAQGILINLCTAAAAAASENRTRAAFAHGSDRSVPSGAR